MWQHWFWLSGWVTKQKTNSHYQKSLPWSKMVFFFLFSYAHSVNWLNFELKKSPLILKSVFEKHCKKLCILLDFILFLIAAECLVKQIISAHWNKTLWKISVDNFAHLSIPYLKASVFRLPKTVVVQQCLLTSEAGWYWCHLHNESVKEQFRQVTKVTGYDCIPSNGI